MSKKIAGVVGAVAPALSFAAADTTAVTGAGTDVAAVGAAVFGVFVAIHLVKWIRRAL